MMKKGKLMCRILTVILTILVTISFAVLVFGGEPTVETRTVYKQVEIATGDTLWDLAIEYKADGIKTERMIDMIMEVNDMSSTNIQAGHRLLIPITTT